MIRTLIIKDFALIESLKVDFHEGLNVVIGETGSGKSMLIDALIIVFGGRASSDLVRNGANKAIVEVELQIFDSKINSVLVDNDIDIDYESIIIRREISSKGNTRNFINDTPVNLGVIKQIGDIFIDFHGQHDHQSLLNSENHSDIFDKSASIDELQIEYITKFNVLKSKIANYKTLKAKEINLREKSEILRFKLDEINKVNPLPNEDEILECELKLLENSELLFSLSSELYRILYDSDDSVWNKIAQSSGILTQLSDIDTEFSEFKTELESSIISIKEIAQFTNSYNSNIEFNPIRIEEIRLRIQQLRGLQKKFGSLDEVLKLRDEISNQLQVADDFDSIKSKLEEDILISKKEVFDLALNIENKRLEYASKFCNDIVSSLSNLGINNSSFRVAITRINCGTNSISDLSYTKDKESFDLMENGINLIEFFISTNLGETEKPLKQVASGGEVSRIMLSIKNILAEKDKISCLVFDEIDTGVSGRIAQMVGLSMSNLAKFHQLVAISHLPQIAAAASNLILVQKFETNNRTYSTTKSLNENDRIVEIAKMMSGNEISQASLDNAKELIKIIN